MHETFWIWAHEMCRDMHEICMFQALHFEGLLGIQAIPTYRVYIDSMITYIDILVSLVIVS